MQARQENRPSSLAPPPTSSSSSSLSSTSSSAHQQNLRRLSSAMGASNSSSGLPPIRKESLRNGTPLNDPSNLGSSYYGKSSMPTAPMSPSEEENPSRFGRRYVRQTSWNDGERRPSSYYDGLRSPDTDRRDERMASLEALRKRRDIPVTLRSRSSSVGRESVSMLNGSADPKSTRHDQTSYLGTPGNILDIRSRSSSSKRDSSMERGERSRRGLSSSLIDSLEGGSERSRRGTSSISESLEGSDRSRRGTSSLNESRSNSPERPILERLLQMKERHLEALLAARDIGRRSPLRGETDAEVEGKEGALLSCPPPRPHSLSLPASNNTESWNGNAICPSAKERGEEIVGGGIAVKEAETCEGGEVTSKKKGRHRISRFLRPDFFDTPREESAFAKKKDIEMADAASEKERKHKESSKSGFLHSLEKQLDRLRGGEKSKKVAPPIDGESPAVVHIDLDGAIPPKCLTSAKLAAEVRKAKLVSSDDASNSDGNKRCTSRVDRAINSLLQRDKGKEFSESGLLKRAIGVEERARPSKSRSSGELAHYGVSGISSAGKFLMNEMSMGNAGGDSRCTQGKELDCIIGGKLSSKVNSVLGMFRRNETEQVTPMARSKRVRRTQSLAYDKTVPDDIMQAIADCAALKSDKSACSTEPKSVPTHTETSPKKTSVSNKGEKVKKSSKAAKEKSNVAKSKLLLQQKEKNQSSVEKASEEACIECLKEKSPRSKRGNKMQNVELTPESKSYDITVTLPKPARRESVGNAPKPTLKAPSSAVVQNDTLLNSTVGSGDRNGDAYKNDCLKSAGSSRRLATESKCVGSKESEEIFPANGTKQLDRTATQDSLDSSSWSACSDGGVGDVVGGEGVSRQRFSKGEGGLVASDPQQRLPSPSLATDGGERLGGCDDGLASVDDSEESVGDRIRRKSFYCRFNDVPLRRRSHHRSTRHSSSLIYSASDLWNPECMKSKSSSSQSRDGFSPPPVTANKPNIYRRSSTSPYHEYLPNPSSETSTLLGSLAPRGLRPASSASSLAQNNGGSQLNEGIRITVDQIIPEDSRRHPSPSPSGAYQNGILPSMHLSDHPPVELERKAPHRVRKFRVPSFADGVTAPSPTHRKYNESSQTSLDGYASAQGVEGSSLSGTNSLEMEKNLQSTMNPPHLPPLSIPVMSSKRRVHKS